MRTVLTASWLLLCGGCASQPFDLGGAEPAATEPAGPQWTGGYGPGGVYNDTARQSLALGDTAGAVSNFEQALRINPFDPVALNNLAVAKAEQGDFHEALSLLERASRLAPGDYEIAANLSRLRYWTQNYALEPPAPGAQTQSAPIQAYGNLPPAPPALWSAPR